VIIAFFQEKSIAQTKFLNSKSSIKNPVSSKISIEKETLNQFPDQISSSLILRIKSSRQKLNPVDPSCIITNDSILVASSNTEIKVLRLPYTLGVTVELHDLIPREFKSATLFDPHLIYSSNNDKVVLCFAGFLFDKRYLFLLSSKNFSEWDINTIEIQEEGIIDYPIIQFTENQKQILFTFRMLKNGLTFNYAGAVNLNLDIDFIQKISGVNTIVPIKNSRTSRAYHFASLTIDNKTQNKRLMLDVIEIARKDISVKHSLIEIDPLIIMDQKPEFKQKGSKYLLSANNYELKKAIYEKGTLHFIYSESSAKNNIVFCSFKDDRLIEKKVFSHKDYDLVQPDFAIKDGAYVSGMYVSENNFPGMLIIPDFNYNLTYIKYVSTSSEPYKGNYNDWGDFTHVFINNKINSVVYSGQGLRNGRDEIVIIMSKLKQD